MNSPRPNADLEERILHAESYPFTRPACSYLFKNGAMHPLSKRAFDGRVPVIASGSNASPERLKAKFGLSASIPVTRAELQHFSVVFAGHFTAYGALPATLFAHQDASVIVWITWLTPEQLILMHRSEGVIDCREAEQRYDYIELAGIELRPERMKPVTRAGAYLSRRMLAPFGKPIRFAEMVSRGASLSARSHRSTLRLAANFLEPNEPFHAFMDNVLSSVCARQTLFERLTPYTINRAAHLPSLIVDAAVFD